MSDSVTLWTIAHQAPPSMGFSKQEYWSGLICTPPKIFPTPGNAPESSLSPALQADSLPTEPPGKPKNDTVASLNTDISANNFVFIFINEYISKQRRQWHPTPVLLPRKSHGRRSLVGCSTWGCPKSQTRLSNFTLTFHFHALEKEMATNSSVLAWRIPGTVEPGGMPSMEWHRVGHDWSDAAAAAAADFQILYLDLPL